MILVSVLAAATLLILSWLVACFYILTQIAKRKLSPWVLLVALVAIAVVFLLDAFLLLVDIG